MAELTIAQRVAAGAAFLDGREPGWWERIDLDSLDLGSGCRCVLGQLATDVSQYASWRRIALRFGLDAWQDDIGLGFMARDHDADLSLSVVEANAANKAEFDALTAEWKRVITERRAGAS